MRFNMAVSSTNNASNVWLDVKGIQRSQRIDPRLKDAIMEGGKRSIRLLSPDDQCQLALSISNVPAVDMSYDDGILLEEEQERNKALEGKVQHLNTVLAEFQTNNKANKKSFTDLEAKFEVYKRANPPPSP